MSILIKNCNLIDGTGAALVSNGWLLINGPVIEAVGQGQEMPQADSVVDAGGQAVIPGLIDLHVHLSHTLPDPDRWQRPVGTWLNDIEQTINGVVQARRCIGAGLTTVRDTGCGNTSIFSIRDLVRADVLEGPRILAAGKAICMTGGHGYRTSREADGPDEVRKAAREQIKAGADWIKVSATGGARSPNEKITSTQLDEDEIRAAVHEAEKVGIRVASHSHAAAGIKNSIRAGVRTIEHAVMIDDEAASMMLDQGTYVVPTLSVYRALISKGKEKGAEDFARQRAAQVTVHHTESIARAAQRGVRVAFGTDSGGPYHPAGGPGELELEARLMTEAGMSPMQVLMAATRVSAEALDLGEVIGTLEPGKRADLVILDGDPLTDLSSYSRVLKVYRDGVLRADNRA
jgi:imidazolonepropionase-like amidohydrolase